MWPGTISDNNPALDGGRSPSFGRPAEGCYFVAALTGSGAAVEHGVALKLASVGSFRNEVLV